VTTTTRPAIYARAPVPRGVGACCERCANYPGPDDGPCPASKLELVDDGDVVWVACGGFQDKEDAL